MIYTSYFANWRNINNKETISIALYSPRWYRGKRYLDLAPSKTLLQRYKEGEVSKSEYREIYFKQLSKLDPHKVYKELDSKVLLCYEKKGDFCHRHLVAEWLRHHGYQVEEL